MIKATVTYCESTDKTHMVRLAFASGSAQFEIPKEDFDGAAVGDEVELGIRALPKPQTATPQEMAELAPHAPVEPPVDIEPVV